MKPILFLDVDGVLNCYGMGSDEPHPEKVALLGRIIDSTGCEVVLSSTWRMFEEYLKRIHKIMDGIGHVLRDCTPVTSLEDLELVDACRSRGAEIQQWLDEHPEVQRYVILDDDDDMGALLPHCVLTASSIGLTPEIAEEVIRRLKG